LASIAILVALLWACALGERFIVRRANLETDQTLRAMRLLQLKNRPLPASGPVRPLPRAPGPRSPTEIL
jgi:hypothetical protein